MVTRDKASGTLRSQANTRIMPARMGIVLGDDAVEVAPPSKNCVTNCQAQDRVRGEFPVLGFPFPVPLASRLP